MSIGPNTAIGLHSVFNGGDDITIGKSCLISGFVYIQTSMHKHDKGQFIKKQGFIKKVQKKAVRLTDLGSVDPLTGH